MDTLNKYINKKDIFECSALIIALRNRNIPLIKILNKMECDETLLIRVCKEGDINIAKILIDAGANVNAQDDDGDTPLMKACLIRNKELFKLLIDSKANVNIQNNNGNTAVIASCMKNDIEMIKLIIKAGCNLELKNKYENTVLMFAGLYNRTEIVKLLVEANAKLNIGNKEWDMSFSLANKEIINSIISRNSIPSRIVNLLKNNIFP